MPSAHVRQRPLISVCGSRFNCKQDKLDWLDKSTKDVLHDFKVLVDSVQKYRNLHKNAAEFITDA